MDPHDMTRPDALPQPVLQWRDRYPRAWPLHDTVAARALETAAAAALPPHALMQRAGVAVARLARAVAPGARQMWIVCGPGNNGGDGFEAAANLQQSIGGHVRIAVSLVGQEDRLPPDAAAALERARLAGVDVRPDATAPANLGEQDLVIDALLGRGLSRPPGGALAAAIAATRAGHAPVLAVDLPSGLPADTGSPGDAEVVHARWTLALLSLPPGLFTARGRDVSGDIWWHDLGVDCHTGGAGATAWLASGPAVLDAERSRHHADHKGSYGDVWVVGGAPGMAGAALLAGRAALVAGAGRVYLARLDAAADLPDPAHPELMGGAPARLIGDTATLARSTVVAGCGGGLAVRAPLPGLLAAAGRLVLDADALNAVAADGSLQTALRGRADQGVGTVVTPHPLEAARLLGCDAATVQADRLDAARALAAQSGCVVVLKGSGTIVAAPGRAPWVLPVGNAALATPGSGDVLAGWLAGLWSQLRADPGAASGTACLDLAHRAACRAVWLHGRTAERQHPDGRALPAAALVDALGRQRLR